MPFYKKPVLILIFGVIALSGVVLFVNQSKKEQASPREVIAINGTAMGSVYAITINDTPHNITPVKLKQLITTRLSKIEHTFSLWDASSELSKINAAPPQHWIPISEDMSYIMQAGLKFYIESANIFDPTILPLLQLWGFGPSENTTEPAPTEISDTLRTIGFKHVGIEDLRIKKNKDNLKIDFSAIIPGYAADQTALILEHYQVKNYLINIGGEMRINGKNPDNKPWEIGIENPTNAPHSTEDLSATINLSSGALATSGSYRRFKGSGEKKRHHIIDPRTGYPAASDTVSVTVYADSAIKADALSTVLLIMGSKDGLAWLAQHPDYAAYFIREDGTTVWSDNFSPLLK